MSNKVLYQKHMNQDARIIIEKGLDVSRTLKSIAVQTFFPTQKRIFVNLLLYHAENSEETVLTAMSVARITNLLSITVL